MNKFAMLLCAAVSSLAMMPMVAKAQDLSASQQYAAEAFSACTTPRLLAVEPSSKKLLTCLNKTWEPTPLKVKATLKDTATEYIAVYQRVDGTCVKEVATTSGSLTGVVYDYPVRVKNWHNVHTVVPCTSHTAKKKKRHV